MMASTWRTWISGTAVFGLLVAVVLVATRDSDAVPARRGSTTSVPGGASTTPAASTVPEPTREPSTDGLEVIRADGRFAVSVLDIGSGRSLTFGHGSFDTASIVKVDILAALLYQHQVAGTRMTTGERSLAVAMIENSNNEAATALFRRIGAEQGLEDFNEMIGLSDTDIGADWFWGLTQTTADDQVKMLQVVFGSDSVLTAASQAYEQELMSHVLQSQRFGVSAAADVPDDAVLKTGALQRSDTWLWDITSIGRIEADGHQYLVAVLSDGNGSVETGVALVDQVARSAVSAIAAQ